MCFVDFVEDGVHHIACGDNEGTVTMYEAGTLANQASPALVCGALLTWMHVDDFENPMSGILHSSVLFNFLFHSPFTLASSTPVVCYLCPEP